MAAPGGQSANSPNQIVWFDRGGKQQGPASAVGGVFAPAISPDEKTIAFTRNKRRTQPPMISGYGTLPVERTDVSRPMLRRTSILSGHHTPTALRSVPIDTVVPAISTKKATNASGEDEVLLATPNPKVVNQWSRDGRFIVYTEIDPKTKADLWVLPVGQGKAPSDAAVPFLKTESNEFQGQLSPDGHWMAYTSDETRQREVYVRPFPRSEGIWRFLRLAANNRAGGATARSYSS